MRRSLDFAEFLNKEVLEEVPYRHVVFTVPKVLRRIFLRDRALLPRAGTLRLEDAVPRTYRTR